MAIRLCVGRATYWITCLWKLVTSKYGPGFDRRWRCWVSVRSELLNFSSDLEADSGSRCGVPQRLTMIDWSFRAFKNPCGRESQFLKSGRVWMDPSTNLKLELGWTWYILICHGFPDVSSLRNSSHMSMHTQWRLVLLQWLQCVRSNTPEPMKPQNWVRLNGKKTLNISWSFHQFNSIRVDGAPPIWRQSVNLPVHPADSSSCPMGKTLSRNRTDFAHGLVQDSRRASKVDDGAFQCLRVPSWT